MGPLRSNTPSETSLLAPVIADREAQTESLPTVKPPTLQFTASMRSQRVRPAIAIVALIAAVAAAFTFARLQSESRPIDSVAVLPFDNLLGDEDRQYLVDALSVAVTNRLAARRDVRVIASGPAFETSDRSSPLRTLARRLAADALVVGSVARAGTGAVINVQLVDGVSDRILWAGRFERAVDEVLLADDIVQAMVAGMGRVAPASSTARVARTVASEARDAYLRGRFFWAKRGQANAVIAIRHLSAAIKLQPDYAEAWAGLADVYAVNAGEPSPAIVPWPGNSVDGGLLAATEALRLEPNLGEAHAALAKLYVAQRRWTEAERSFARAVDLSPQYSTARQWYGTMLARLRRCDEALEQVTHGARLDPLTPLVNEAVGSVYLDCGEAERAIEIFDAVLVMHPAATSTRQRRAQALCQIGRHDDAIRELDALTSGNPNGSLLAALGVAYARAGHSAAARAALNKVSAPYPRAQILASIGDTDAMFEMLEQALTTSGTGLQNLIAGPLFERYFEDARFIDLAQRAGFPMPIREARFSNRVQTATASAAPYSQGRGTPAPTSTR